MSISDKTDKTCFLSFHCSTNPFFLTVLSLPCCRTTKRFYIITSFTTFNAQSLCHSYISRDISATIQLPRHSKQFQSYKITKTNIQLYFSFLTRFLFLSNQHWTVKFICTGQVSLLLSWSIIKKFVRKKCRFGECKIIVVLNNIEKDSLSLRV